MTDKLIKIGELQQDTPQNHVRASNTKFCIILNHTKIGTQYVRTFNYEEKREYEPDTEFNVTLQFKKDGSSYWKVETGGDIKDEQHKLDYDALNSFLNGTTNKDVIILIRDPYERFISAFNQDFIKPLWNFNNDSLYFLGLSILPKDKETEKLYNWWLRNRRMVQEYCIPTGDNKINVLDENYMECISIIIKSFIYSWKEAHFPLDYKHNNFYHATIVSMLFNNRNKYKIFDIDNTDMNDIFSKYLVGNKTLGKPNESNYTKQIIKNVFEKDNELKQYVLFGLNSEQMAYNSLKQISKLQND